jgi:hypothetical protein
VEERVWHHLERRRLRALHALGAPAPTADEVARAVFDDVALPLAASSIVASARIDRAADELARVANQRRLRRHASAAQDRAVFARPRRPRHGDCSAIALYEQTRLGPGGGLIERRVFAHIVSLRGMRTAGAWRDVAMAVRGTPVAGSPDCLLPPMRQALLDRIAAARSRLGSQPLLHQASLFDRRAQRGAGARREIAARVDAALARRAASLSLATPQPVHTRLIAFWPLSPEP